MQEQSETCAIHGQVSLHRLLPGRFCAELRIFGEFYVHGDDAHVVWI